MLLPELLAVDTTGSSAAFGLQGELWCTSERYVALGPHLGPWAA